MQLSVLDREYHRRVDVALSGPVTLNGKPAKIMGYRESFAHVGQLNGPLTAEFSWPAITRIMADGGDFRA